MRNLISSVSPCLCKQPKCSLPLWVFIEKPWGNTGITIPKSLGFLWVHQVHVGCSSLQWEGWQRISCDSDIAFTHSLLLLNKAKPTRFSSALGTSTTVWAPGHEAPPAPAIGTCVVLQLLQVLHLYFCAHGETQGSV